MDNESLLKIAINARKNALAEVSQYTVGAALLASSGTVYIGANVEEYSILGLSNCAERVAIQNAISHGERNFVKNAIVGGKKASDKLDEIAPCGVCLQYILDMCKNIDIITIKSGEIVSNNIEDYLKVPYELNSIDNK